MKTQTPTLEFDAEAHKYTLGGTALPSVTQIIQAVLPVWEASDWYLQRGAATHHGCRLLDEGRLDWTSVDPEIEPRIRAWQKFRIHFPADMIACEKALAHPKYRYAGTLDRILERKRTMIVADLKNSISAQVRLQLAAYSLLWTAESGETVHQGVAVELLASGDYRCLWMDKFELRPAEQQWLALLTTFNFAQEHNLLRDK